MSHIVKVQFGSHLYGTNTPHSDLDFRSIYVPTAENILLGRTNNTHKTGPDKAVGEKNQAGDVDNTNYSIQKYFDLLRSGDTGALDMLFAPSWSIISSSPSRLWEYIQANRKRLLSKKSAAFVGYCRQQANKYGIKGSRIAAAKNAMEFFMARPMMSKVGEHQADIEEQLLGEHTSIIEQQINSRGDRGLFLECCGRKVGFGNTCKEAATIFTRIYENYGARARLAQTNEGVDWKALSHAVRVGQEALELLTTGHITLPLPYAAYVLEIKKGLRPYEYVAQEIEQLLVAVEAAEATSVLPDKPDNEFMDELLLQVHHEAVSSYQPRKFFTGFAAGSVSARSDTMSPMFAMPYGMRSRRTGLEPCRRAL